MSQKVKFVLATDRVRFAAVEAILALDIKAGKYEVLLRRYTKDRSAAQNDRMWALHRAAAKETGHSAEEMHAFCCAKFLGWRTISPFGGLSGNLDIIITTTCGPDGKTLTVEEMTHFTDQVEAFYATIGVWPEEVVK